LIAGIAKVRDCDHQDADQVMNRHEGYQSSLPFSPIRWFRSSYLVMSIFKNPLNFEMNIVVRCIGTNLYIWTHVQQNSWKKVWNQRIIDCN